MKTILYCVLLVLALSCKETESDSIAPEYADWYTLKAPVDQEIQGVWGDWDKTLLISTTYQLFRSTDRGQNWQQVDEQKTGIFGIVAYKDTLFAMNGLLSGQNRQLLVNAGKYSVDDGKSWQEYHKYNPYFDNWPSIAPFEQQIQINPIRATSGVVYKINQVFLDGPTATTGTFETPGVITQDGRRIDLPQLHQLHSLYLDASDRLYIAGTDAICGRGHSGENFFFCNSKQGRGVVYVSKHPLP